MNTKTKFNLLLIITGVAIILGIALFAAYLIFLNYYNTKNDTANINSYEECAAAGFPIQESYPPRCVLPDGRGFTQEITPTPTKKQSNLISPTALPKNIYGISNGDACESSSDCVTAGCNQEICAGRAYADQPSICVFPKDPTPGKAGYTCRCVKQQCLWEK